MCLLEQELEAIRNGTTPSLRHLRLHGTVACYLNADGDCATGQILVGTLDRYKLL